MRQAAAGGRRPRAPRGRSLLEMTLALKALAEQLGGSPDGLGRDPLACVPAGRLPPALAPSTLPCPVPRPSTQPTAAAAARHALMPVRRWQQVQWVAQAGGSGGGGDGGSSGGGSGGGGGGGGGDDDKGEVAGQKPAWGWKGWQDRVAADPQFVYKVVIEQLIGVTANVLGDMVGAECLGRWAA